MRIKSNKLVITTSWDDGNNADLRVLSLLEKYQLKGTFYIPQSFSPFKTLTDDETRQIAKTQEIGAHTINHSYLAQVDLAVAKEDISNSKGYIKELTGAEPKIFSYPGGSFNRPVKELVAKAGFIGARTTKDLEFDWSDDNFELGTSLHIYPFPFKTKNANYKLLIYQFFLPLQQGHLKRILSLNLPAKSFLSWQNLARSIFDHCLDQGDYFHLWGHSYELDRYKMWPDLENIFKYISRRKDCLYLTNSETLEYSIRARADLKIKPESAPAGSGQQPLKLVYLIDNFFPDTPTSPGMLTLDLAQEMQRRGHDVSIITTVQDRALSGRTDVAGLPVYRIFSDYHERWRAYYCLYNPQTVGAVRKILKQIQPDICHFQNVHSRLSYFCLRIAKLSAAKVFITCHDVQSFNYGKLIDFIDPKKLSVQTDFDYRVNWLSHFRHARKRYNPLRNIVIRHYLHYADKIFAVSEALKEALNQNKIDNVAVIHNGLNLTQWSEPEEAKLAEFKKKFNLLDRPVIFFGGRLSGAKGGEQIIAAFKKVLSAVPGSLLLVAGEKSHYFKVLSEKIKEDGLADSVVFTGFLNREELRLAYSVCTLTIVPSICFDSFPTMNLEAMSLQKPVIATCFGGSREAVINNQTGFIVNPFDESSLADKMIILIRDRQLAHKFGQQGLARMASCFSLQVQTDKLEKYYITKI